MTDRKLTEEDVRALLSPTEQQYLARMREAEKKHSKAELAELLRIQIRGVLKRHPSGLPVKAIAMELGRRSSSIYNALLTMRECWVDRWTSGGEGRPSAIWRIVPDHCPPPRKK